MNTKRALLHSYCQKIITPFRLILLEPQKLSTIGSHRSAFIILYDDTKEFIYRRKKHCRVQANREFVCVKHPWF